MTQLTGVSVTRFFTDAMDMLPQRIDLLGVSMSWELDFVGLFDNLQYMNVNRKALLRKEDDPLVFGGGPVLTANPEPFVSKRKCLSVPSMCRSANPMLTI